MQITKLGKQKTIDFKQLDLEVIDHPKLRRADAVKRSLETAIEKELPGFVLTFKKGELRILSMDKTGITSSHLQFVSQFPGTPYCIMRNAIAC